MLRPATPLSVLLFVAAAMLVISVLSTPIIKGIPLGTFDGVNFGVFGFCKGDQCSKVRIGYDASPAFTTSEDSTFDLPPGARATISSILIVHPIAAFIVSVYFVMAVVAHIHSAFHSSRYLLCLFLMGLIGFIASLLAFLVDVLLFVPHLAWGSYLVLTATILVAICGIVSCGMRRAMVGRKARRKRVEENNEMNGQNYYNNRSQPAGVADAATSSATTNQQPTVPVLSGAATGDDSLPGYATYESQKKDDQVSDERIPLTARSPSNRSPNPPQSEMNNMAPDGPYGPPSRSNMAAPPRDPYGNPMGPPDAYGDRPGPGFERMRGRGGMPPGGARGRGGYGPPGRGGYGPGGYGPPPPGPGRGGYGPPGRGYGPPRGGYGPPRGGYGPGGMMRGGRTPPPGGYQGPPGAYDRRGPPADQYGAYQGMDRRSPGPPSAPDGYVSNMSNMVPPVPAPPPSYQAYTPDSELPRAESPPPLPGEELTRDRPVEMDATPSPINPTHQQYSPLRDSDADVAGMVGLQQARVASPNTASQRHNTYISETSHYSTDDQYVPIRQNWNQNGNEPISPPIPSPQAPFPTAAGRTAAELPDNSASASQAAPLAARADYYEDVDPSFAGRGGNLRGRT